jgi:hypothetical protein
MGLGVRVTTIIPLLPLRPARLASAVRYVQMAFEFSLIAGHRHILYQENIHWYGASNASIQIDDDETQHQSHGVGG